MYCSELQTFLLLPIITDHLRDLTHYCNGRQKCALNVRDEVTMCKSSQNLKSANNTSHGCKTQPPLTRFSHQGRAEDN